MSNLFRIKSFRGGISDWENTGIAGSFKFASNIDIRKAIDSLSCQQALTDDLAAGTMEGLDLFIVNCSDGNSYHFCKNGKIYKRTSAGVYSLVYTDSEGVITGAAEWFNNVGNKFLYWATATKLHRIRIDTAPEEPWVASVDATVNGQTYPKTNLTSATWHTMKQINGNLYIANAALVAMVGYDDSYTTSALALIPNNLAKCLMEYNGYAYIGCSRVDNSQDSSLFVWDTAQALNWNTKAIIPASAINALISAEFPLMQVGASGQMLLADVANYQMPITSFPSGGSVNPDGVEVDGGLALFGVFGNGTGKTGVYSYGRKRKNASAVLNLEYQLNCDEIGSVRKVGSDVLVSYKSGSSYGVKKVATTKATGTYQSLDLVAPVTNQEPVWAVVRLITAPLPASTSIEVWRRIDKNGSFVKANLEGGGAEFSTDDGQEAVFLIGDKGKICEIQIVLNQSSNSTPEVYEAQVFFE